MNYKIECNCDVAKLMRGLCPVPGYDYRKLMIVELKAGERVAPHSHKGHAVLYYPSDAEPIQIEPKAGTIIYIPPGIRHSVPPVTMDRVSFAMIVDDL